MPEPLSRFELAEQMRRQGFPLALPQGWDGQKIPSALQQAFAQQAPGHAIARHGSTTRSGGVAPKDFPVSPDFFDENQRRSPARLGDFEILTPHRATRDRTREATDPQVPFGEKFACEKHEPAITPRGAVIECDELTAWWFRQAEPGGAEEPPQGAPLTTPLPTASAPRTAALNRIRADRRADRTATRMPPSFEQESVTAPDGAATTDGRAKSGTRRIDSCTASPPWTSPPPALGKGGGGAAPQPSPGGGGGGEEDDPDRPLLLAVWQDPCPCKCFCASPFAWLVPLFATFAGMIFGLSRLLRPDKSLYGVSDFWEPSPVVGPPDGWLDQLILQAREPEPVLYASPTGWAPGSAGLFDADSPELAHDPGMTKVQTQLLVAGLSEIGEPALRNALPVPVGPGPGIPGIGSEPFFPADGSRFEAAPGALFAGAAPAVGFGAFGGSPGGDS